MVYLLLVFGFDIVEPTEVNIRYTFYICNNINDFDSWTSGKKSHGLISSISELILLYITKAAGKG
jgi:hypothetical protein